MDDWSFSSCLNPRRTDGSSSPQCIFLFIFCFSQQLCVWTVVFCCTLWLGYTPFDHFLHCLFGARLCMFVQCSFVWGLLNKYSHQAGNGSEKKNTRLLMIDVGQLCELGELGLLASGWTPKTTARVTQTGILDALGTKGPHNVYLIHRFKTSRDNIGKYGFTVRPATTFRLEVKMLECSGRSSFKSLSMKSFSVRGCGRGDLLLKVSRVRRPLLSCVESSRRELSGMLVSFVPKSLQWMEGNRATAALRKPACWSDCSCSSLHAGDQRTERHDQRGKKKTLLERWETFVTSCHGVRFCWIVYSLWLILEFLPILIWNAPPYLLCFQSLLVLQLLRPFELFLLPPVCIYPVCFPSVRP